MAAGSGGGGASRGRSRRQGYAEPRREAGRAGHAGVGGGDASPGRRPGGKVRVYDGVVQALHER